MVLINLVCISSLDFLSVAAEPGSWEQEQKLPLKFIGGQSHVFIKSVPFTFSMSLLVFNICRRMNSC